MYINSTCSTAISCCLYLFIHVEYRPFGTLFGWSCFWRHDPWSRTTYLKHNETYYITIVYSEQKYYTEKPKQSPYTIRTISSSLRPRSLQYIDLSTFLWKQLHSILQNYYTQSWSWLVTSHGSSYRYCYTLRPYIAVCLSSALCSSFVVHKKTKTTPSKHDSEMDLTEIVWK